MPPLFDRLAKGAGKAVEQAKFEAEKLKKTNALGGEISKLKQQALETTAAIGQKMIELKAAGVAVPAEVEPLIETMGSLKAQLTAKEEELAALKAMQYAEEAAPPAPAPTPAAPAPAAAGKFCPNCGAKLADGAKFCPDCGTKIG
jgi:Tfp pilus assembly protein FimV